MRASPQTQTAIDELRAGARSTQSVDRNGRRQSDRDRARSGALTPRSSQRLDAIEGQRRKLSKPRSARAAMARTKRPCFRRRSPISRRNSQPALLIRTNSTGSRDWFPQRPALRSSHPYAATGCRMRKRWPGELGRSSQHCRCPPTSGDENRKRILGLSGRPAWIGRHDPRCRGNNWRDVAERARAYAETNDLPAAISLIERAGGEPPAALQHGATRPKRGSTAKQRSMNSPLPCCANWRQREHAMIKLIWRFALLTAVAAGFAWLADRPGVIMLRWLGREIEMPLYIAVAACCSAVFSSCGLCGPVVASVPRAGSDGRVFPFPAHAARL